MELSPQSPNPEDLALPSDLSLQSLNDITMTPDKPAAKADLSKACPQLLHGFTLVEQRVVPFAGGMVSLYRHAKSGAGLLSIENNFSNKCFAVSFDTPPSDSTGVQHILEHSVLCGSRDYPLKDPFAQLLKGSLHTFLNALTSKLYTYYPVASENQKDFYNLARVYLDTVFNPLLRRETFETQGWRFEVNPDDSLGVTGVVFNEMKGARTSPTTVLYHEMLAGLFPDTVLRHDSGGKPEEMLHLTYEGLKDYHNRHYCPANARLVFFGDDPVEERLKLADEFLSSRDPGTAHCDPIIQQPFDAPRRAERSYPLAQRDKFDEQALVTVNWACPAGMSSQTSFEMQMLGSILLEGNGAPLYRALRESGLGRDVLNRGHMNSFRQEVFVAGLQGTSADKADAIEGLIVSTLQDIVKNGISRELIESVLKPQEYRIRLSAFSPRAGLSLVQSAVITRWHAGHDPVTECDRITPLQVLKDKLAAGEKVFENLISAHLLANPHRLTMLLKPDSTLQDRRSAQEQAFVAAAESSMDQSAKAALVARNKDLGQFKETPDSPEDLMKIPRIKVADLDPLQRQAERQVRSSGGITYLRHPAPIDNLLATEIIFDLFKVPERLFPLVPMFCGSMTSMGTDKENYGAFAERIRREVGSLSFHPLTIREEDTLETRLRLAARGVVFAEDADKLTGLLQECIRDSALGNQELFLKGIGERLLAIEQGLESRGHGVAMNRALSHRDALAHLNDQFDGIGQIFYLRGLQEEASKNWPAVEADLRELQGILLGTRPSHVSICGSANTIPLMEDSLSALFDTLPDEGRVPPPAIDAAGSSGEALIIPSQVNYVAAGFDMKAAGYVKHGSYLAALTLLDTEFLWNEVRLKGNAYGAGCKYEHVSGQLVFYSYRDPHVQRTLDTFRRAAKFLQETEISDDTLERLIVGTSGQIDPPKSPFEAAGDSAHMFLRHRSQEDYQQVRDELLSTTVEDIREFGRCLERAVDKAEIAVLGPEKAINEAEGQHAGLFGKKIKIFG